MAKKIVKKLIVVYFQIGVNVIGLPDIISHNVYLKTWENLGKPRV